MQNSHNTTGLTDATLFNKFLVTSLLQYWNLKLALVVIEI